VDVEDGEPEVVEVVAVEEQGARHLPVRQWTD
jgi:hypothetical protein